ncbi:hypothetical protein TEA_020959 [Camellia sinensis var. sinensis]|uniref:Uncharacterized protein n=1 Tax=Camellia sinensis var. sinensis TaxID=542762 RepID=A0A4S4D9I8_CAMSN|nr:hypothetical protein TEA_020959 [Camellia sinensis var. sinensis]
MNGCYDVRWSPCARHMGNISSNYLVQGCDFFEDEEDPEEEITSSMNPFSYIRHIPAKVGAAIVQAAAAEELAEGHSDVEARELTRMSKNNNNRNGRTGERRSGVKNDPPTVLCKALLAKQLASKGIIVVLTARDEKKGFEALEKLKSDGLSDHVVFCQLDVVDPSSVSSLAEFVKSKFGRLDILVNNAGILGAKMDWDSLQSSKGSTLILSEWAKGVLNDVESLTEERVEEVLNEFLKDLKEGALETKGWPTFLFAYTVNAYTRILAKKYPTFRINCVCPGWTKTDINNHIGKLTIEQGAQCPVKLALLLDDGPSGLFFANNEPSSFV